MVKKWETRTEAVSFDSHPGHSVKKHLFLSSADLKLIAIATMLVDHVGMLFFPEEPLFRVIGRLAFPIFAFFIAEGFEKTSSARKYLFRLFIFALISQIPYSLFMQAAELSPFRLNIFFTLSAGLLSLMLLRKLPSLYSIPSIVTLALVAELGSFDYGGYGILLVLASSLFLHFRTAGLLALFSLPLLRAFFGFFGGFISVQLYSTLSVPLLMVYDGSRGREFPRLLLYGFYPAHIAILTLIWYLIN